MELHDVDVLQGQLAALYLVALVTLGMMSLARAAGFVWPFLYPSPNATCGLERVRSINTSGHKYGLVYPGIGWLAFRETADLADDRVLRELSRQARRDVHAEPRDGSAMVLARYYDFVRLGREGYTYTMETMQGEHPRAGGAQLRGVRRRLAAGRRAGLDRAGVHAAPDADHVTIMRALVKLTLGHTLADDLGQACSTLEQKGGLHPLDRKRPETGTGYCALLPSVSSASSAASTS